MSKSSYYRNRFEFIACVRPQEHGKLNMWWNRVTILQPTTTPNELLQDKPEMMPHKSCTLPNNEHIVEIVLPHGTKCKGVLATIIQVRIVFFLVYLYVLCFCQIHFQLIHMNNLECFVGQRH